MYCQGCSGFASNGEPEIEIESHDNTTEDVVSIEAKITVPCGGCESEFKEGYLSTEVDLTGRHECPSDPPEEGQDEEEDEDAEVITFEISEVDAQVADDYRPKYKTLKKKGPDGNPITRPVPLRYQRHWYDATITLSVRCTKCDEEFEVVHEDSLSAGELEEAG